MLFLAILPPSSRIARPFLPRLPSGPPLPEICGFVAGIGTSISVSKLLSGAPLSLVTRGRGDVLQVQSGRDRLMDSLLGVYSYLMRCGFLGIKYVRNTHLSLLSLTSKPRRLLAGCGNGPRSGHLLFGQTMTFTFLIVSLLHRTPLLLGVCGRLRLLALVLRFAPSLCLISRLVFKRPPLRDVNLPSCLSAKDASVRSFVLMDGVSMSMKFFSILSGKLRSS